MILSKAGKLTLMAGLLCLLLMGFAGASYGAVRWDVVQAPTEVINTGRSEVLGSVTLYAFGNGTTGTSTGGFAQIGFIFTNGVQIDNSATTGIKMITDIPFATTGANVPTVTVQNVTITGRCTGFLTINLPPGVSVVQGNFIRIEGVRGRIDISDGITVNTDLFVQLQSINDPAANQFTPDTVRVAKTLPGMQVNVVDDSVLLCFPPYGTVSGNTPLYKITITEGFVRAFVNYDNNFPTARVDSTGALIGAPTNATRFRVVLNSIPASISSITWPLVSTTYTGATGSSQLVFVTSTSISGGIATADYEYTSTNQTGYSDITLEKFDLSPALVISSTSQTATGTVLAAVSLYPSPGTPGSCDAPDSYAGSLKRPRFATLYQSSNNVSSTDPASTSFDIYATIVRCNCYLLFTYVTKDSFFNTGIAIANTTGDTEVFGSLNAPDQTGPITFYFYDKTLGYVGNKTTTANTGPGQSFVGLLSEILPSGVTTFSGYVIAKANFQYCHGYAFIADSTFANIAQGYLANVIPDPAVKGNVPRSASAASDLTRLAAGESLNN